MSEASTLHCCLTNRFWDTNCLQDTCQAAQHLHSRHRPPAPAHPAGSRQAAAAHEQRQPARHRRQQQPCRKPAAHQRVWLQPGAVHAHPTHATGQGHGGGCGAMYAVLWLAAAHMLCYLHVWLARMSVAWCCCMLACLPYCDRIVLRVHGCWCACAEQQLPCGSSGSQQHSTCRPCLSITHTACLAQKRTRQHAHNQTCMLAAAVACCRTYSACVPGAPAAAQPGATCLLPAAAAAGTRAASTAASKLLLLHLRCGWCGRTWLGG